MIRKKMLLLITLPIILASCSQKIDEADLIGGTWMATDGYENGEPEGDPYCIDFIMEGLEFKEDSIVYSDYFDEDYIYYLEDRKNGTAVVVERKGDYYSYTIEKTGDDEIGLRGANDYQKKESCYLERK